MRDDTNPPRPRPIQSLGAGSNATHGAILVGVALGLVLIGAVLVPVIRLLMFLGILSCVGFFLSVVTTQYLGYMDIPSESPRIPRLMFIAVVSAGLITFAAIFGVKWLAGFLVYVASVVGILVRMEKRRRLEEPPRSIDSLL